MLSYDFKKHKIRKSKGISKQELTKLDNTTQDIISNNERGAVSPTLDRLLKFKKVNHK